MHRFFRFLTLSRIGAVLFLAAAILLTIGILGALASWGSEGSMSVRFNGMNEFQTLLLGFAFLVCSAIVFGLAIINERLVRIEAKLDSLGKQPGD